MNLANRITIARILIIPVFMVFLLVRIPGWGEWIAGALFVLAALTDGVDGWVARSTNKVTVIGKFLDPLADKLLVSAALIALVALHNPDGTSKLSPWIATLIISREFAVSGLRMVAVAEGRIISASAWGKAKTTLQVLAVTAWILLPKFESIGAFGRVYYWAAVLLMGAAVVFTVVSGIDYFVRARDVLVVPDGGR
jgi:CDP-diacylglycerol---glycerol-3-phosphate 3-phosphatidyltransferase